MVKQENLAHLDLDTLAWLPSDPPERAPFVASAEKIRQFITNNSNGWVIEGCYTDLLEAVDGEATEIIFMNLPVSLCVENARNRPWEPHKYASEEAQNKNLEMLIRWIEQYSTRRDGFSYEAHLAFFEKFSGSKKMISTNEK